MDSKRRKGRRAGMKSARTLSALLGAAKEMLRSDGELVSLLFVFGKRKSFAAGVQMPPTASVRRARFFKIGQEAATAEPQQVILLVDAYFKAQPSEDAEWPTRSLADDPEAKECILVTEMRVDGSTQGLLCTYERHPLLSGLQVEFGPDEILEPEQGMNFLLEAFFQGVKAAQSPEPGDV